MSFPLSSLHELPTALALPRPRSTLLHMLDPLFKPEHSFAVRTLPRPQLTSPHMFLQVSVLDVFITVLAEISEVDGIVLFAESLGNEVFAD